MYLDRPLIFDSFAGGGGASTGIAQALGRSPDFAINHNPIALAMHAANHPDTFHISENVWRMDPLDYLSGKHIGLAWFSPDCKHFSKAKGGKPVERNIRDLAWIIPGWIERIQRSGGKVDVVILENVEEFRDWSPLIETEKGLMPDPARRGETFTKWCRKLRALGGKLQYRELRACDYGAPTIRKRLFIIIRFDGRPIVWPRATHGAPNDQDVLRGKKKPYEWVAHGIDWSLPCPSIFDTAAEIKALHGLQAIRPLADATMSRVARGVHRYVLAAADPFVVHQDQGVRVPVLGGCGGRAAQSRERSAAEPFHTSTSKADTCLITPSIVKFRGDSDGHRADRPLDTVTANSFIKRPGGAQPLGIVAPVLSYAQQGGGDRRADGPAHTLTASDKDQNQIVAPYMVPRYGERPGQEPRTMPANQPAGTIVPTSNQGSLAAVLLAQQNTGMVGHDAREPLSTIVQKGCTQSVVAANLIHMKGSERADQDVRDPSPTVCASTAHSGVVVSHLTKYYGVEQESAMDEPAPTATTKARFAKIDATLDTPPLSGTQMARARDVAAFLRSYGFWDDREIVTVTIQGVEFVIVDIGMRMLTPRELFNAQGFPVDYQIELTFEGRQLSKSDQIACCGNSVCPPVAEALVAANCNHLIDIPEAVAA